MAGYPVLYTVLTNIITSNNISCVFTPFFFGSSFKKICQARESKKGTYNSPEISLTKEIKK